MFGDFTLFESDTNEEMVLMVSRALIIVCFKVSVEY